MLRTGSDKFSVAALTVALALVCGLLAAWRAEVALGAIAAAAMWLALRRRDAWQTLVVSLLALYAAASSSLLNKPEPVDYGRFVVLALMLVLVLGEHRLTPLRALMNHQRWLIALTVSFTAWAAGSALWSFRPIMSLTNAMGLAALMGVGIICLNQRWLHPSRVKRDTITIWAFLSLTVAASLAAGVFGVFDPLAPPEDRLRGLLANPNTLALVCILVLPLAVGLWRERALPIYVLGLTGVASAVTLVWTQSRMGMLAALVGMAAAALQGQLSGTRGRRLLSPAVLVMLGMAIGLVSFGPVASVDPEVTFDPFEDAASVSGRSVVWSQAVELWRQEPIGGHGFRVGEALLQQQRNLGQLVLERVHYGTGEALLQQQHSIDPLALDTVHNGFLQVLLETGLVGFALIVGIAAVSMWPRRRSVQPALYGALIAGWMMQLTESSLVGLGALFAPVFWLLTFMLAAAQVPVGPGSSSLPGGQGRKSVYGHLPST